MTTLIKTLIVKIVVALAGLGLAGSAWAAVNNHYPEKTVRIVVPLTAGSPPDIVARVVAEKLSKLWGQAVIVENKPGATGAIGMSEVARSAPDGYTVGLIFMTHTVLPSLLKKMMYETDKDLAPIGQAVWAYNVLCVPANSPFTSLQDIIAAAKGRPNQLVYGSGGNGSPSHLIAELVRQKLGLEIMHVPYRGPSEALSGLLSGDSQLMFVTTSVAAAQIKGGKLKALAVTSEKRVSALPEVPTLAELGIKGMELREWEGFVAPAGTPAGIIDKWNQALRQVLAMNDVKQKLAELGLDTQASTPAELARIIETDLNRWPAVIKAAHINGS